MVAALAPLAGPEACRLVAARSRPAVLLHGPGTVEGSRDLVEAAAERVRDDDFDCRCWCCCWRLWWLLGVVMVVVVVVVVGGNGEGGVDAFAFTVAVEVVFSSLKSVLATL